MNNGLEGRPFAIATDRPAELATVAVLIGLA